jgi:hypothetical protein
MLRISPTSRETVSCSISFPPLIWSTLHLPFATSTIGALIKSKSKSTSKSKELDLRMVPTKKDPLSEV